MARRLLSRVGGFVHDINTVSSLSDEPNNIRLLSDRSLYILQNLSQEDITFLSRYGEILTGDFYLPVLSGSPEESIVEDAIDLIRRDLNSMSVEELLECLCTQLSTLATEAGLAGQEIDTPPSDGIIETGPGHQFETQSEYFDAKCSAANAIYDTVLEFVDWLEDNNVDVLAGVYGGVTSGVSFALVASGPVGWAVLVSAVALAALSGFLIAFAVGFDDLHAALVDVHDECVLALFNASDAITAETEFVAAIAASIEPTTALERQFVEYILTDEMANQLFAPRDDTVLYESPDPVDCGAAVLALWTFPVDAEGFVFQDDSTSPSTASGVYDGTLEALKCTMVVSGSPSKPRSRASWVKSSLSLAIPAGSSAQFDYTGTSDAKNQSKYIKVTYSDASFDEKTVPNTPGAGTLVMTLPIAKTISTVLVQLSRASRSSSTHTSEILEVRIIGT